MSWGEQVLRLIRGVSWMCIFPNPQPPALTKTSQLLIYYPPNPSFQNPPLIPHIIPFFFDKEN